MYKNYYIPALLLIFFMFGCKKFKDDPDIVQSYSLYGSVQKGPFINGSDVTIYELNNNFKQTGRSFHTSTGFSGEFELTDISLASPYIEIIADGFYFNEVTGDLSTERISLSALAELSDSSMVNVNILTHLEAERTLNLLANGIPSLTVAAEQAQLEVLTVFSLDSFHVVQANNLNILDSDEDDAILLAISSIMQGNNSTSELSKLSADLISDIKTDGVLNDTLIQNTLLGGAVSLNCSAISQNLLDQIKELNMEQETIIDFESYVTFFINNCGYHVRNSFTFPILTTNGVNVLSPDFVNASVTPWYTFAAVMPKTGKLEIRMQLIAGTGIWVYQPFEAYGWKVTTYDYVNNLQLFSSSLNGELIELPIKFEENGTARFDYFYNGEETPSFTKTISWGLVNNSSFNIPNTSPIGPNLLNKPNESVLHSDSTYVIALRKEGDWSVNFTMISDGTIAIENTTGWGTYSFNPHGDTNYINISGKQNGDYISEIGLKLTGSGNIHLFTGDIKLEDDTDLDLNFSLQ